MARKTFSALCICLFLLSACTSLMGQSRESILKSILSENEDAVPGTGDTNTPETGENPGAFSGEEEDDSTPAADTPDQLALKTGIELYNSRLYDRALEKFNEIKKNYPNSPFRDAASIWAGRIYLQRGNYDNALEELSGIPETSGEYPASLFLRGEIQTSRGNRVQAVESFKTVSALFPEHELADNALLMSARIYLREKQGTQSLDAVLKIIKYYRNRETIDDAYYWLGEILMKDPVHKDVESARKIFQIFLKRASDTGNPHFYNSPLKNRAARQLQQIESTYFQEE